MSHTYTGGGVPSEFNTHAKGWGFHPCCCLAFAYQSFSELKINHETLGFAVTPFHAPFFLIGSRPLDFASRTKCYEWYT